MKPRRWFVPVGIALMLGLAIPGIASAASSATACPSVTWGSNPKSVWDGTAPPLGDVVNVRAGRQTCFDRMVIDLNGITAGYALQYEPQIYPIGGGPVIPVRGGAKLSVIAYAPAYDDNGRPTYRPVNRDELVDVTGYQTFRQIVFAGSYEGSTAFGLGLRARLPFRVFIINEPTTTRIVVDVAHSW